jgi:hypothetical protein
VITVVSASYGAYDQPIVPLEQDVPVRYVMVTDGAVEVPEPWETVVEPRPHLHPRMAAKIPKCFPHRYGLRDRVIWLDASARILRPDFVSMCARTLGNNAHIAQWLHPQRNCILDEAFVSSGMAKYAEQPVYEQVNSYVAGGHPKGFGLWATGCMVWNYWLGDRRAGSNWLVEQMLWTYQDQLSWPVVVRDNGLDIVPLPGGLWDRTYVEFRAHASDQ